MPALKNPRHEAFAQAIFSGIVDAKGGAHSQAEAYRRAGYNVTNGNSARACASRLLTFANGIGERIKELQDLAAEHALESADKCVQELNQLRRDAHSDKAYGPAVSAVMGKAKLLGLVTDKHEDVTSKPDFTKATSLQDVGLKLLQAVGYESPSPADVALALQAHETMIAQLEAIAGRAGFGANGDYEH
jgi:phage terminase small subunit